MPTARSLQKSSSQHRGASVNAMQLVDRARCEEIVMSDGNHSHLVVLANSVLHLPQEDPVLDHFGAVLSAFCHHLDANDLRWTSRCAVADVAYRAAVLDALVSMLERHKASVEVLSPGLELLWRLGTVHQESAWKAPTAQGAVSMAVAALKAADLGVQSHALKLLQVMVTQNVVTESPVVDIKAVTEAVRKLMVQSKSHHKHNSKQATYLKRVHENSSALLPHLQEYARLHQCPPSRQIFLSLSPDDSSPVRSPPPKRRLAAAN